MNKSKSPKKQKEDPFKPDPEIKEKARKAQAERARKKESFFDKYGYYIVGGVMLAVLAAVVVSALLKMQPNIQIVDVNDATYIDKINSEDRSFKVGPVKMFEGYKLADAKKIINSQANTKKQLYRCNSGNKDNIVPDFYNFRESFAECARPAINGGNCSSAYSLAAVGVINDRWCRRHGANAPILSGQVGIACDKYINSNCKGGYVSRVLDYAKLYGLVKESCLSYDPNIETPEECQKKISSCDKFNVADYCVSQDMEKVKQEIFNFGPVIAVIPVYRDFLIYKSGVYQVYPKTARFPSGHAVKIIGWEIREGKECWLIENSWGPDWGADGIACLAMKSEELQVEQFTIAVALKEDIEENREKYEEIINEESDLDQSQNL